MKTQKSILILPLLLMLIMTSCFNQLFIDGNGDVVEEDRTIPEFTQIASSGDFDIYYEYAEETSLSLSGESNLLMYVETVVYDNELKIRTPYNIMIRKHQAIEVYVKGPFVEKIDLSGSGLIHTDTIYAEKLELNTSGSGNIETAFVGGELFTNLSGSGKMDIYTEAEYTEVKISGTGNIDIAGESNEARFVISGSGKFYGYDCLVDDMYITISGSGNLYVTVRDYLEALISGSGNVYYQGNPQIKTTISGTGSIIQKN